MPPESIDFLSHSLFFYIDRVKTIEPSITFYHVLSAIFIGTRVKKILSTREISSESSIMFE